MDFTSILRQFTSAPKKPLVKKGTLKIGVVETTPVVFHDRLLRFEWIRNHGWGKASGATQDVGYYHFIDMETEEEVCPPFALDHSFGCCYAEDGVMYVQGVRGNGGGNTLACMRSEDLIHWEMGEPIVFPEEIRLYNTSCCKGKDGYVLAIEIGGKHPAVGRAFTIIFATSQDLMHWELMDMMEVSYSRERYTACPVLRYYDGYYYMIYLEAMPLRRYVPYIVRTKDLKEFESSPINPVMFYSDEDKALSPTARFTEEQKEFIRCALNCNNSDVDLCNWKGKTVLTYSWGNQVGKEFLAWAEYDGSEQEFLESFF